MLLRCFGRFWFPLLLGWLLAGCRSGQAALQFQPGVVPPAAPIYRADSSAPAMAATSSCPAILPKVRKAGLQLVGATHSVRAARAPERVGAPFFWKKTVALARLRLRPAAARQARLAAPNPPDWAIALGVLGLLLAPAGLLTLVVAAAFTSGTVAFIGLGLVVLGVVFFIIGLTQL